MGPQETMDWEFTIDNITNRLTTLENQNRSHAQRTADIQGAINMVDAKIVTAVEDIGEYKKFVTSRFDHFGNVAETKFNEVGANVAGMESNVATVETILFWQGVGWMPWMGRLRALWKVCEPCKPHSPPPAPHRHRHSTCLRRFSRPNNHSNRQLGLQDSMRLRAAANQSSRPHAEVVHLDCTPKMFRNLHSQVWVQLFSSHKD